MHIESLRSWGNLERRRGTRGVGRWAEREKEGPIARSSGESVRGHEVCATVGEDSPPALHRSSLLCIFCTLTCLLPPLPPFLYSQISNSIFFFFFYPRKLCFDLNECDGVCVCGGVGIKIWVGSVGQGGSCVNGAY